MPEPISKLEIAEIEARGGKVSLMAKIISIPGLEQIARHFHDMKHEQAEAYKVASAAKLEKMDELIKVLDTKPTDLMAIVAIVAGIKSDHATLSADFLEHKAHCDAEDEEDEEPCEYKLTGKRDRRGFIDLEYGLTFTPVKKDE